MPQIINNLRVSLFHHMIGEKFITRLVGIGNRLMNMHYFPPTLCLLQNNCEPKTHII